MRMTTPRAAVAAMLVASALGVAISSCRRAGGQGVPDEPPATLRETGLYADWTTKTVAAQNRPYTPQYPLWSDGASKRRWIYLPGPIDASDPDAWQFPVGTKLWKEFSFGARTETRYMVRTAAGWRFATYAWTAGETDATRVPVAGQLSVELRPGVRHRIPSEADCRACHSNGTTPVLGFSALQLSPDRDPNAPHREAVAPGSYDLPALFARGLVRGMPASIRTVAPRIPGPPLERAALGYLHANCGNCHRADGPVAVRGLVLLHSLVDDELAAKATTLGRVSELMPPALRVAPGDPERSVLVQRMRSRAPLMQMPPLGTQLVDAEASRLIATWIAQLAQPTPRQGDNL